MKIRQGFVSNSSSSSFLIYGAIIEGKDYDEMEEIMKDVEGFEWADPCDEGSQYVGKSWGDIGDNETGRQFKDSVEKVLKEKFGKDIKCNTLSEAWYNG